MGARQPTMGFPCKQDAIASLARKGIPNRQIAKIVGSTPGSVKTAIYQYAIKTGDRTVYRHRRKKVGFSHSIFTDAAKKRGISNRSLMYRISAVLCDDPSLIDALLDDLHE